MMTTNLVLNGSITPVITFPNISAIHGATLEDGVATLNTAHAQVNFDVAGTVEGQAYALSLTVADLVGSVRVRVGMSTSGTGATGDFTISAEGATGPLYFTADGNEATIVVTAIGPDDVTIGSARVSALSLTD